MGINLNIYIYIYMYIIIEAQRLFQGNNVGNSYSVFYIVGSGFLDFGCTVS